MASRHNTLRGRLADQYNDLLPRACSYCESMTDFPHGSVKQEVLCISPSGGFIQARHIHLEKW